MIVALIVSHTTIYRWSARIWQTTLSNLEKKNKNPFIHGKWMKYTSKLKGKWHYLYRAIDADGLTWIFGYVKKRDTQTAYAFLERLVKQFDEPKVVVYR